ncbi:MAG: SU10 major capsid protein [Geminicoccaceae bacterium]
MAVPANTQTTFGSVGNREDLTDEINMLSPTKTPFYSGIGEDTAYARIHDWQEDELDPASTTNQHVEGDDKDADAVRPTDRRGNPLQIFKKIPQVAGTQQAVRSAGRPNEMRYQVSKRSKEIKRDIEARFLANLPGTNTGAATDDRSPSGGTEDAAGRALAGLPTWLTGVSFRATRDAANTEATGVAAAADINAAAGFPEAAADLDATTKEPLNENAFMDLYSDIWLEGAEPDCVMMNPAVKNRFSALDGNAPARINANDRAREEGFDIYSTDYGVIEVVPQRFMHIDEQANEIGSYLLLIDKQRAKKVFLRRFVLTDLSKTGDSERKELLTEITLKVDNIKAHGILAGIDSAVAPVPLG